MTPSARPLPSTAPPDRVWFSARRVYRTKLEDVGRLERTYRRAAARAAARATKYFDAVLASLGLSRAVSGCCTGSVRSNASGKEMGLAFAPNGALVWTFWVCAPDPAAPENERALAAYNEWWWKTAQANRTLLFTREVFAVAAAEYIKQRVGPRLRSLRLVRLHVNGAEYGFRVALIEHGGVRVEADFDERLDEVLEVT